VTSLSIGDVFTPAPQPKWLSTLLGILGTIGVPATAWQSGGVARTMVALNSFLGAAQDSTISGIAQGGFLDYAATGTTTFTNVQGITVVAPVTPDPSIPAQLPAWLATNGGGWLDILADSTYNVQRILSVAATGGYAFANTAGVSYGPFAPGTYHVGNGSTGATYTNTASLTIAAANFVGGGISSATNASPIVIGTTGAHGLSTGQYVQIAGSANTAANGVGVGNLGIWAITVIDSTHFSLNSSAGNGSFGSGGTVNVCTTATITADVAGVGGTSVPNAIQQQVSSNVGVVGTNPATLTGSAYEGNVALALRCRLKIQALSPNGPPGAYLYFALSASQILAATFLSDGSGGTLALAGGPVTRAIVLVTQNTGIVTTVVANANGGVAGVASLAITNATNASPIVLTTASPHGLSAGAEVYVSGVVGNSGANGYWTASAASGSSITLAGSTGTGAYLSGGTVEGGDLGLIDTVIQANAVPLGITATTVSAASQTIGYAGTVYVPLSQVAAYQAAVAAAITTWLGAIPIGGLNTDNGTNLLPYDDFIGILYAAGIAAGGTVSYVRGMTGVGFVVAGGSSPTTVTGASWSTPITITTSADHFLSNNEEVIISGVGGNTAANGTWVIAGVTRTPGNYTFQLVGSVGTNAFTSGGTVVAQGDIAVGASSIVVASTTPLQLSVVGQ